MIKLDYDKVVKEADKLEEIKEECNTMCSNMGDAIKKIEDCWKGSSAKAFIEQCEKWKKEISSLKDEIDEISNDIKRIAKSIKDIDEKAAEAARKI